VIWVKTFKLLPFGANSMGMGYPTMGIIAGQFVPLATILFLNCYFDKWPFVRKQSAPSQQGVSKAVAK
jgi:AAT family amino acid transporter